MQQQIACFGCGKDIGSTVSEFRRQKKLHISLRDAQAYANTQTDLSQEKKQKLVEFLTEAPITDEDALTESGAIRECCRMTVLGQQDVSSTRVRAAGRPVVDPQGKLTVVDIGLYETPPPKPVVRSDAHKAIIPPAIAPDLSIIVPVRVFNGFSGGTGESAKADSSLLPLKLNLTREQQEELQQRQVAFKARQTKKMKKFQEEKGTTIETLLEQLTTVENIHEDEVKPSLPRFNPGVEVTNTENGYIVDFIFEHSIETRLVVPPPEDAKPIRAIRIVKAIKEFLNSPMSQADVNSLRDVKIYEMQASKAYRILDLFRTSSKPTYAEVHDNVTKSRLSEGYTITISAMEEPTLSKNATLLTAHALKLLEGQTITKYDVLAITIGDHNITCPRKAHTILRSPFADTELEIVGTQVHKVGVHDEKLFLLLENLNIIVINDSNATLDDGPLFII